MLRIISDRIRIRSGLEGVLSVRIRFRVSTIRNRSVSEYSKVTFLWYRYALQSYSTKTNIIHIRLRIRTQIWKQIRYQWYLSVSDPFSSLGAHIRELALVVIRSSASVTPQYMGTWPWPQAQLSELVAGMMMMPILVLHRGRPGPGETPTRPRAPVQ